MSNALSIFNQLRPVTVGYDNIFDHFEKMFEDDFFKNESFVEIIGPSGLLICDKIRDSRRRLCPNCSLIQESQWLLPLS